jgi:hypothetical protein
MPEMAKMHAAFRSVIYDILPVRTDWANVCYAVQN